MTGYIIYYQQQAGGHNGSEIAGATATTATISGLITGATYSITIVVTSTTLPSSETAPVIITIGKCVDFNFSQCSLFFPACKNTTTIQDLSQ